jgi:cytochrome c553
MTVTKVPGLAICLGFLTGLAACGGGENSSSGGPAPSQEPGLPTAAGTNTTGAAAAQGVAMSAEQKAKPCLSCHSIDNFAGLDAAALEASMQAMRNGEIAHLPLPDSLSDQDLADIAAYLEEAAG